MYSVRGSIKLQVEKWAAKAKEAPMVVVKETIQEMNNWIIPTSPFKTGYLRGSYFAALNQIPAGKGAIGREASAAVNAVLVGMKAGDKYYMGNTAAYARRLELGFVGTDSLGRTYNQRGRFWVLNVVSQAPAISNRIAESVAARL